MVLKGLWGVAQVKASYPEGKVVVGFDPAVMSEDKIAEFINKVTGFTAVKRAG